MDYGSSGLGPGLNFQRGQYPQFDAHVANPSQATIAVNDMNPASKATLALHGQTAEGYWLGRLNNSE